MNASTVMVSENFVKIPKNKEFSPLDTFSCGQAFRWKRRENGNYIGVAGDRLCEIAQTSEGTILLHVDPKDYRHFWYAYFDLPRPYKRLQRAFSRDPILKRAVAFAPGLRLLRQEPFETLCTFIISQNNNIPRITGIVERLCKTFGKPLSCPAYPDETFYAFPTPQQLAGRSVEDLAPLRAGFRARYLLDAAQKVADGSVSLDGLDRLPLQDARGTLTAITGVGVKVADCTLLFAYGRMDAFPLDVWMKRVMSCWYPSGFPESLAAYSGLAQQYLFHYARSCKSFPRNVPPLTAPEQKKTEDAHTST